MVNVLQIIINMPLYNIQFPSNALVFFGVIMNIANFNVIPADWISENLFTFTPNYPISDGADALGYGYTNLV